mgnify:CR=1 FL=1
MRAAWEDATRVVVTGWDGGPMPEGMKRGAEQGEYVWEGDATLEYPMVWIPPGCFVMGSPESEAGRWGP